jgi:hypothetical protein
MLTRRVLMGAGLAGIVAARVGAAASAPTVPTIDRLKLTILADSTVSSFAVAVERPGLKLLPPQRAATAYRLTLRGEWG